MAKKLEKTVMCYIFDHDKVLLLYRNKKKNDINEGKYIGVGGHIEEGETPLDAVIREVKEETNLDIENPTLCSLIYFENETIKEEMYVYKIFSFKGELIDCDEGRLEWIDKKDLFSIPMWEGDQYFLKPILENAPYFEMILKYQGNTLIKRKLLK